MIFKCSICYFQVGNFKVRLKLWLRRLFFESATTLVTRNSSGVAADGHSPYIVSQWKWMMVIIDRSKAYMTGSSNDECERRQQVDGMVWYLVSPLLSQHESPAQHPSSAQGNGRHRNFTTVSFFLSSLCVCVCALNTTVPFHQVLVPAIH